MQALQSVLIVVHLLVVIALVGVVLLQRSEGGALGTGGGGGFMTGRGQANELSRATAIRAPRSILDQTAPATNGSTEKPAEPNLLDQLKGAGEPATPAPSK
jgi:preprotein translocase subunit SecG